MSLKDDRTGNRSHTLTRPRRRQFLVGVGAAGALSVLGRETNANPRAADLTHDHPQARPFQCVAEPGRQRKSFRDLTDKEVRLLCRAIGYMRSGIKESPLSVSSPLQWDNWVSLHARHCTEATPGKADQVHWSWFFLPWHRAYLWFLERHLANIVKTVLKESDAGFALPYWDWTAHKEMPNTRERVAKTLPSPLFGYDPSKEDMVKADDLGFDNMALWDGYRKPTPQQPTMDPANERAQDSKEHIEETIAYMSPQSIALMLLLEFEDFAGKAVDPNAAIATPDGMGILEHYPHNNGHDWVGSRLGKSRDMGSLRYAALDPIFFMHHANIDRIWSLYRRTQPDPDKPWGSNGFVWGKQAYTFVDVDGSLVSVTVSDVIKCMTNVTYLAPQLEGAAPSLMKVLSAQAAPAETPEQSVDLVQATGTLTVRPLTLAGNPQPPAARRLLAQRAAGPAGSSPSLLVIETGPIPYPGKFTVRVFLNKPDADATTSSHDPHYVGRIRALDSEARATEGAGNEVHTFSILIPGGTHNLYSQLQTAGPVSVTLVPLGPSASDETFRIPVRRIRLKMIGGAQ
jgi:polyphenol oxidase